MNLLVKKSMEKNKECKFTCLGNDFELLRTKGFVIFGVGSAGRKAYFFLKSQGIEPNFFCDNNKDLWTTICYGKKIISPDELRDNQMVVLIASVHEKAIEKQLIEMGIKQIITYGEFLFVKSVLEEKLSQADDSILGRDAALKMECQSRRLRIQKTMREVWFQSLASFPDEDTAYLLHSFPKTGNNTIKASCKAYDIPIMNYDHSKDMFVAALEQCGDKNIKIITGIREPISCQISQLFQATISYVRFDERVLQSDGVQVIFDDYFLKEGMRKGKNNCYSTYAEYCGWSFDQIEFFDEHFKDCLDIDVYEYPFDKEKGYTIIKKGNVELLIYQLEKLSTLEDVIKEFLKLENLIFVDSNKADDKWYDKYYNTSKKNIQLPVAYINNYYNSKFMKHFYKDSDIQVFYKRWSGQIYE